MSNVCPTIPHKILKDRLDQIGVKLVSPISFLRIGAPLPEYSHILSFRRQAYITPAEHILIPESMEVSHEDLTYRIFLSLDSQKCFNCKLSGHIASQCPSIQSEMPTQQIANQTTPNNTEQSTATTIPNPLPTSQSNPQSESTSTPSQATTTANTEENPNQTQTNCPNDVITSDAYPSNKRSFSEIQTPTTESVPAPEGAEEPFFATPKNKKTKKPKTDTQPSHIPESAFEPVKVFIDNHSPPLVMNSEQVKSLLENTHGSKDIASVVSDHSSDFKGTIELLLLIYPHIIDKTLKNRCTRLRKKMEKHLETNTTDHFSDTSSVDSTF
nr:unnamed protein product [Callosobruchus analis]